MALTRRRLPVVVTPPSHQIESPKLVVKLPLAERIRRVEGGGTAEPAPLHVDVRPPSVIDLINGVLDERNTRRHYFRPSMIGGCERKNVFFYLHAPSHPQRHDPRMHRVLDNGTAIHGVVQRYLGEHIAVEFTPEVMVRDPELEVEGHSDGVFRRRTDGYRWGLELKTKSHSAFMDLTRPDPKHVRQALTYGHLLKVPWMTLLYWDKDKHYLREYPVRVDASLYERYIGEPVRVYQEHIRAGTLPEYDKRTCDIEFCEFAEYCHAEMGIPLPAGGGFRR